MLDQQEGRAGVGRERSLPLLELEVHEWRDGCVQGIVDQDVDLAEGLDGAGQHGHQLVDDAEVALDEPCPTAGHLDGVDDGLSSWELVNDYDLGAEGGQGQSDSLADTPSPAGDQRGLAGQRHPIETEPVDQILIDGVHQRSRTPALRLGWSPDSTLPWPGAPDTGEAT